MHVDEFLKRVEDAAEVQTLYLLGHGSWRHADEGQPHPEVGPRIAPRQALDGLKRADAVKYARYLEEAARARIDIDELRTWPPIPVCDCSRFVGWALEMPHDRLPNGKAGSLYTGSIIDDAKGARLCFAWDRSGTARRGDLLVYAAHGEHEVGHVGVITAVEVDGQASRDIHAAGRPLRVVHCAPENFLAPPPPGGVRTAIAETDVAPFFPAHSIVVGCKRVER